ncbi:MAG: murein L,D-transpeptidase catalytic domain family protein, partial [Bdellovibrionaceae bacterium]|nr:murein L,D-transpeptidase catalytic domain family protein [Pseudobdellovibrionaceae bacterium]
MMILAKILVQIASLLSPVALAQMAPEIRQQILSSGVPSEALDRILTTLASVRGPFLARTTPDKAVEVSVRNHTKAVIIDFSRPSTEKRFFYIDLVSGQVESHYVAHGRNTGLNWAVMFSNIPDSKTSSLGLYITGPQYTG